MRLVILGVLLGFAAVAVADPPDVARFTATARNLARAGNCKAVEQIAAQVSQLDATYYDTVFRIDPVIASCDLPTSDKKPDVNVGHGLTFDVEVGGGFGYYSSWNTGWGGYFSGDTDSAQVLNIGTGVGVFANSRLAIGVRGLAAFSRTADLKYQPPGGGFGVPPPPATSIHTKLSNEIALLDLQLWIRNYFWVGSGVGCGRIDLAPAGHATYGFAADLRVGVALPYGFEASFEAMQISTERAVSGLNTQLGFAFLVGWQFL